MNILLELFVVTFRVLWAFVLAAAKWLVRPKEKSVAGQVCLITGAGSGLGRLFALEFARRRALLVLWDINTRSNEETAGMVRHIYRELAEAASAPKGKRGSPPRRPPQLTCAPCLPLPAAAVPEGPPPTPWAWGSSRRARSVLQTWQRQPSAELFVLPRGTAVPKFIEPGGSRLLLPAQLSVCLLGPK